MATLVSYDQVCHSLHNSFLFPSMLFLPPFLSLGIDSCCSIAVFFFQLQYYWLLYFNIILQFIIEVTTDSIATPLPIPWPKWLFVNHLQLFKWIILVIHSSDWNKFHLVFLQWWQREQQQRKDSFYWISQAVAVHRVAYEWFVSYRLVIEDSTHTSPRTSDKILFLQIKFRDIKSLMWCNKSDLVWNVIKGNCFHALTIRAWKQFETTFFLFS